MTQAMTQQQFDAYLAHTGNGISSDNGNVAYVSDGKGDVVAMFWRGEQSYLETLDEPIGGEVTDDDFTTKDLKETICGGLMCIVVMVITWLFMGI